MRGDYDVMILSLPTLCSSETLFLNYYKIIIVFDSFEHIIVFRH